MKKNTYSIHSSTGYWVTRLARALESDFEKKLQAYGVTRAGWAVLSAIYHNEKTTPAALADFVGIDRAAITRHLDRIEQRGFISRHDNGIDRRSVIIKVTKKGEELVPQIVADSKATNKKFLAGIDPSEADALQATIKKMLMNGDATLSDL